MPHAAPLPVFLAAAATVTMLVSRGTATSTVELQPQGFRIEGTDKSGKRVVVQALFAADANGVAVSLTSQTGRRAQEKRAAGVDYTTAVLNALA